VSAAAAVPGHPSAPDIEQPWLAKDPGLAKDPWWTEDPEPPAWLNEDPWLADESDLEPSLLAEDRWLAENPWLADESTLGPSWLAENPWLADESTLGPSWLAEKPQAASPQRPAPVEVFKAGRWDRGLRSRRPHVFVQSGSAVSPSPPSEANSRVDTRTNHPKRDDLDHPFWAPLHRHPHHLLTVIPPPISCGAGP
jgi:hypothetical protein